MFTFRANFKHFVSISIILTSVNIFSISEAKTIRVAVVDTGYDFKSTWRTIDSIYIQQQSPGLRKPKICTDRQHADFTTGESNRNYLNDEHGHGTHIAGIIAREAGDADYCLVIIKYYSPHHNNLKASNKAILHAIEQDVDIINYSSGGRQYSQSEYNLLYRAIAKGIRVVASAGNEKSNIDDKRHRYYPASYSALITSVGNVDERGVRQPSSNYGRSITDWRMGVNVYSLLPGNQYGLMTGTSQATAVKTGEIVREMDKVRKFDRFDALKYLKLRKEILAS